MKRENFFSCIVVIVLVLSVAFIFKLTWKYGMPRQDIRTTRLEKQMELMRRVVKKNDLINTDLQKEWDKTFIEREE